MSDDSYYDELGVTPDASRDELKAAYQERVSELEAAREKKGVTDAQLQGNREQVARVRSAWNVLADPFQRSRYDERIGAASTNGDASGRDGSDVEVVDDGEPGEPDVQLTGWRRLMAPAPPKKPAASAGNGKPPPPQRRLKEPTIPIPSGMRLADPRSRGMALLFDFAVVLVIYWVVLLVVPGVINSDYQTKVDQINHLNTLHDARSSIQNAQSSVNDANTAIAKAQSSGNSGDLKSAQSDKASAQKDLKSAQADFDKAAKDVHKDGLSVKGNADAIQKRADKLSNDIRGAQYGSYLVVLVLAMLYLVPATTITGRTLGMRGRRIRVVRVDGSPVGWYGAFTRFLIPILVALAIPTIGPLLGLGMVLWGYRDANGQGVHDKLARTLVVANAE
jgi:curved DNA-binding protein CbpA